MEKITEDSLVRQNIIINACKYVKRTSAQFNDRVRFINCISDTIERENQRFILNRQQVMYRAVINHENANLVKQETTMLYDEMIMIREKNRKETSYKSVEEYKIKIKKMGEYKIYRK